MITEVGLKASKCFEVSKIFFAKFAKMRYKWNQTFFSPLKIIAWMSLRDIETAT